MLDKIKEAVVHIQERIEIEPEIGLILGSGLGVMAEDIEDAKEFPYEKLPNFPVSTVEGHAGKLIVGELEGKKVVAMQGRFHYYEGYSMQEITLPVRVMKLLGIEKMLVTNAAGGVNRNFNPGDFMIITDIKDYQRQIEKKSTNQKNCLLQLIRLLLCLKTIIFLLEKKLM